MTIDERLEALTHTVELMAGMQMQVTERQDLARAKLQGSQERTELGMARLQESQEKTERTLRQGHSVRRRRRPPPALT